jgi:thioredoxin 1
MHILTTSPNFPAIQADLANKPWLIACLCAAWCDTCEAYKAPFAELAKTHPDKCFAWIDIEDQADLIGDVDIENFPTILIEHADTTLFFGTMLPDTAQLARLISSLDANASATTLPFEMNLRASIQEQ